MILSDFKKCGYDVKTKLFKIKWYDIPQNRERVIFIGIRNDIANKIKFKWPEEKQIITKTLFDAIGDLPIEYDETIQPETEEVEIMEQPQRNYDLSSDEEDLDIDDL